jgi:plasmid maintenance system antidote protein VapI
MTPEDQIEAEARAMLKTFKCVQVDMAKAINVPVKDLGNLFGRERKISKAVARALGWERQWVKTGVKND